MRFRFLRGAQPEITPSGEIEIPRERELQLVISALRSPVTAREVDDAYFDRIYPAWARSPSKMHWTPVQVARRAAELVVGGRAGARILDVGSGVGKFCIVGSLTTDEVFHGVEQRPHFVALCQAIVRHYRLDRLAFFDLDMRELDWSRYDGVYLFNPFQENRTPWFKVDSTIAPRRELFDEFVEATVEKLAGMPRGTRVVTYHGFGGEMPAGYRKAREEHCVRGPLACWVKG